MTPGPPCPQFWAAGLFSCTMWPLVMWLPGRARQRRMANSAHSRWALGKDTGRNSGTWCLDTPGHLGFGPLTSFGGRKEKKIRGKTSREKIHLRARTSTESGNTAAVASETICRAGCFLGLLQDSREPREHSGSPEAWLLFPSIPPAYPSKLNSNWPLGG